MERDEYLLFNQPLHSLPQYVRAHQLAGDLELAPEHKAPADAERLDVLERLSRK